jgi:hypothetical protein
MTWCLLKHRKKFSFIIEKKQARKEEGLWREGKKKGKKMQKRRKKVYFCSDRKHWM